MPPVCSAQEAVGGAVADGRVALAVVRVKSAAPAPPPPPTRYSRPGVAALSDSTPASRGAAKGAKCRLRFKREAAGKRGRRAGLERSMGADEVSVQRRLVEKGSG